MSTFVIGQNSIQEECNADDLANDLVISLSSDVPDAPEIDLSDSKYSFTPDPSSVLYREPEDITIDKLTEISLDGDGIFDKMMRAVDLHINREFKDNRITGDQYAKVYVEVMLGVLNNATQFLLTKDQNRWQSIQAQMQARITEIQATSALIDLERVKLEAAKLTFEMATSKTQYALTKINVANAQAQHCLIAAQTEKENYVNENILPITLAQEQNKLSVTIPLQNDLIQEQIEKERAQTLDTRSDGMTPIAGIIGQQRESLSLDIDTKTYALENTLPIQLTLLNEQIESERSKTVDNRIDGSVISGSVGKQKELYTQQIDSFIKDSQYKTAKMYLDSWITQKTLDEGLAAPLELTNTKVNEVMENIRTNNNL